MHQLIIMNDSHKIDDPTGGIEGTDEAALGTDGPPTSAPPGAQVGDDVRLVPGAGSDDVVPDEAKPWFTSLAAASDQAGVANESADSDEDD